MKVKVGVLSVLGNHDYCLYRSYILPDSPQKEVEKVIQLKNQVAGNFY